ncbi:MAG TPA: ribonuclease HII, partial [Dissulfurispiraceae bacterium]
MDPFAYDEVIREEGFTTIAGVDEAGRGPLAGPVVAAAVTLPRGLRIDGVRDSKKIPEGERAELFWEILARADDIGVGVVDAEEIDRINILCATRLAMHNAITGLSRRPDVILIDALRVPSITITQKPIIKG